MVQDIRIKLVLFFLLVFSFQSYSAERDSSAVEHRVGFNVRPGMLTQHHAFFRGENALGRPMKATGSAHLQYSFKFPSGSVLGRLYPSAYQGVGTAVYTFGNHDELGTPAALYVFQGASIASFGKSLSLDYEWNFGVSVGWRPYDEKAAGDGGNPNNVAIGTKVNAYVNAGLFLSWRPASQWTVSAGIDYTHFSNGDTTYPNSGVNSFALRMGAVRSFEGPGFGYGIKHYGTVDTHDRSFVERLTVDVMAFGAWTSELVDHAGTENIVDGKFAVAGLHVNPLYDLKPWLGVGASLDIQYNEGMNIQNHIAGNGPAGLKFFRPPFMEQFGAGLSLRAELRMPIFAVNLGAGHNVIYKGEELGGFYGLVSLKTFFTENLYANVGLKVCSRECSNNLLLGIGWRFHTIRNTK